MYGSYMLRVRLYRRSRVDWQSSGCARALVQPRETPGRRWWTCALHTDNTPDSQCAPETRTQQDKTRICLQHARRSYTTNEH
ncbi:unnamed protein product [Danaus chrysippus]|uniref:(African queen) hypothetical protein n=1 Tax=Danaus chrysippus TaxID=151541 RepID=A0A8J2VTB5_9NEOP|nr:unnamed protein product [Danaus chrysippus]